MPDDPASISEPPSHPSPRAAAAAKHQGAPVYREIAPPPQPSPGRADARSSCSLGRLNDVELNVAIEIGRLRMRLEDVLKLDAGAVLELDKRAHEPVDVWVNDKLVARGEVVVVDGRIAVRVSEVLADLKHERVG